MTRFSVGGDGDGDEERAGIDRSLPKRCRPTAPIIYTFKRSSVSVASTSNSVYRTVASNSGNPPSTSDAPDGTNAVEEESEEESERESDSSFSDSSEEESDSQGEDREGDQQNRRSENELQPTAVRGNSTANGNRSGYELAGPSCGAQAPVILTLTDPDVLDCPICLDPLNSPIYQCENGHVACSSCCIKIGNKCGSCCWPIGYNRCSAIEKLLESIIISCPNKKHGCMESLKYTKKLDHEKTCSYAPCSCPFHNCNYVGLPERLYAHFSTEHSRSSKLFRYNYPFTISLDSREKRVFLQERCDRMLFILNSSRETIGSCINVVCIAPFSSKRQFVYVLTARDALSSIRLKTVAESTPQWIADPPVRKYVIIPKHFVTANGYLTLELTIWMEEGSVMAITRC